MTTTPKPVNPNASFVEVHEGGGTSFVGPDAVNLYRAITLKVALKMYAKSGMLMTRTVRPTNMLLLATEYTGKSYKRGEHAKAAEELTVWIETMKTALPITNTKTGEQS